MTRILPLLSSKKRKTALAQQSSYDFEEVFQQRVKDAQKRLIIALKAGGFKAASPSDLQNEVFLKMRKKYDAFSNDFIEKTSTIPQWIAYYVSCGIKHHLNDVTKAMNRRISFHDLTALVNDLETRSLPGLQVEESFDLVPPHVQEEVLLQFIHKLMDEEDKEVTRDVLRAWFIDHLDQKSITAKYNVPAGSISSIVSRFKKETMKLCCMVDIKALVESNDDVEAVFISAKTAFHQAKKAPKD
jgi:hypothetical protein